MGLLADTHDRPHPRVFRLFADVDRILHAGDVCTPEVLAELEALAPVTAVYGNCCTYELRRQLPATAVDEVDGRRIFVQHDIGTPTRFRRELTALFPDPETLPHVVLSGHSHHSWWERVDGVWFVNPGSAGPARLRARPSAAILTLNGTADPAVEFIALAED